MIRFLMQKLLHKKWMVVSLLIGNVLLIAIACSNPMYKNASLQRTLTKSFGDYIEKEGVYPGVITIESAMTREQSNEADYIMMSELSETLSKDLGVKQTDCVQIEKLMKSNAKSLLEREDNTMGHTMSIASMTGIEEHIKLLAGRMYEKEPVDGVLEAIVSQKTFSQANLILDEEMQFKEQLDSSGNPIVVKIVGVFTNSVSDDNYWIKSPSEFDTECFIAEPLFEKTFINTNKQVYNIESSWNIFFDYTALEPSDVKSIVHKTEQCEETYKGRTTRFNEPVYMDILKAFLLSQNKIVTTLLILQVPVLVLLCAFIFMISRQMLDLEQNEIALLKSRGSSKMQIISIYALQSVIITAVSAVLGLLLGSFLCRVLGSANGFLEFVHRSSLKVRFDGQVMLYLIISCLISIAVMVLPVFKDAGVTIVNYKQQKNKTKKPLWRKVYLDVLLFAVSIYGLYSFTDRKDMLMARTLSGESVDPMLFLCASLFIISAGLVALRIQPLIVKLVYVITKRFLKPASFASFLQILRSRGKQSFMMVFLMLTVALGIYNTTVARTILSNAEKSVEYQNGADVVFKEVWKDNSAFLVSTAEYVVEEGLELTYTEPDYTRFESLSGTKSLARVLKDKVDISGDRTREGINSATIMGINTKEFGETVNFDSTLLYEHINTHLNVLGSNKDAVLLSMNFHTILEYDIGDKITYINEEGDIIDGQVYGFFDYWPSYIPQSYSITDEGVLDKQDEYMVVANLAKIQEVWGVTPYQIWLKTDGSTQYIYDYAEENELTFTEFYDSVSDMVEIRNDTLFQGTNGILTMSFIVVLILCCVGFLIYWILSIRSRELLFGVFRAMGMKKREIIRMLINEQIFSSGISIVIGAVIGVIASKCFVPLVQIFYSTTNQAIPLTVVSRTDDMIRLFGVIAAVILICMIILGVIISRIKISQALKLGED